MAAWLRLAKLRKNKTGLRRRIYFCGDAACGVCRIGNRDLEQICKGLPALLALGSILHATGENIVGPDFLVLVHRQGRFVRRAAVRRSRSGSRSGLGGNVPVCGRIRNSPNISVRIERDPNQKILAVIPQGETICHPPGHASSPRQVADHDWCLHLQRAWTTESTSLRADDQYHALVGKWPRSVKARYTHRNLHANPRASSSGLRCQYFHCRSISQGKLRESRGGVAPRHCARPALSKGGDQGNGKPHVWTAASDFPPGP